MSYPTEISRKAKAFLDTRNHYFNNAKEFISKKEWRKASEMLWGAVTQSLKAVAALRNVEITNHRQFFSIAQRLSKDLNDPSVYYNFVELNTLHRNFYDEFIPENAFPLLYGKAKDYLVKLDAMLAKVVEKEVENAWD